MSLGKKHIAIAVGLGVVSIAAGAAYLQYRRIMNYCIGFKNLKINKLTQTIADIDLYLNFKNNSNLKLDIQSQEYSVYVNNILVVTASNPNSQVLAPESMSVIGVNVKFNPNKAGQNILSTLLSLSPITIRVDMKLKIKLWFFTVNVPYSYVTSLKELMVPNPNPQPKTVCK